MKKLLAAVLIIIAISSCKKNKEYCWICTQTSTGHQDEVCGMTEYSAQVQAQRGFVCEKK